MPTQIEERLVKKKKKKKKKSLRAGEGLDQPVCPHSPSRVLFGLRATMVCLQDRKVL